MIEGLKPYAEYKDSGQEWLGGVPAHWDLKPGHAAFWKRKESNRGMKEKTVLSLNYGRIKVKATDKQHGLVPESYETYQVANEGQHHHSRNRPSERPHQPAHWALPESRYHLIRLSLP